MQVLGDLIWLQQIGPGDMLPFQETDKYGLLFQQQG